MPGPARQFGAAHVGYAHQDVLVACALVALHIPGCSDTSVRNDVKLHPGDLFDDLTVEGMERRRRQIKWHKDDPRPLTAADLRTTKINFRIDDVVASFLADELRASEYRLVTTFGDPDEEMAKCLVEDPDLPASSPGLPTRRFRLSASSIWPEGGEPIWTPLCGTDRAAFVEFCDLFVIETGCPPSSLDLREPGELETHLISLLETRLGLGRPPNASRDLADAAAHLIFLAMSARADKQPRGPAHVTATLALNTDYGRVPELLPIDPALLVPVPESVGQLIDQFAVSRPVLVTGVPGAGKSWLLHELRRPLLEQGHLVAVHYCFVDLHDPLRDRRSSIDVVFGSLIAELYDLDPSLVCSDVPRYAAGPRELETILASALGSKPDLRITLIVDGLDHADRLSQPGRHVAQDIVQELAELELPAGVQLVVGSQPGGHLTALMSLATVYKVEPWDDEQIRALTVLAGIRQNGEFGEDVADVTEVQGAIIEKARGNPLYATYLCRTALGVARGDIPTGADVGVVPYLLGVPKFDVNLSAYYRWLLDAVEADTGAVIVVRLLALVRFSLTTEELGEILPPFKGLVPRVLSLLSPVLIGDSGHGGVRVYHESFQRFVQAGVDEGPGREAILKPAREWLDARGFLSDERAFRWLFSLLRTAGSDAEIIGHCDVDFVANAAAHGQPGDAMMANLTAAAQAAVKVGALPDLARIVELTRTADYLYRWRLENEDLAQVYGRAYASLHGPALLASRLLHEGRPTFRPRPGLVLCQLCDEADVDAPWSEYLTALERLRATDNTVYFGGEMRIENARLVGEFRLAGAAQAAELVRSRLSGEADATVHPFDASRAFARMFGTEALLGVINRLGPGPGRGWAQLAASRVVADAELAVRLATEALEENLEPQGMQWAVLAGGDPSVLPARASIDELTTAVAGSDARERSEALDAWIAELDIAVALGDDAALCCAETLAHGEEWYRRWLRFAVRVRLRPQAPDVLDALRDLSADIDVFRGSPRVVVSYFAHDQIGQSLRDALAVMDDGLYPAAAEVLFTLSDTSAWPELSRSGPFPLEKVLEALLATADTPAKREAASRLSANRLRPEKRAGEVYDTHASDQFLLAMLHAQAGQDDLAQAAWHEGCTYLAAYGHRKDITVFEVIDPLPALGGADPQRIATCLASTQPLAEAVLAHTDGRGTRGAVHQWADHAAALHPAGGLLHVAREALLSQPTFGHLDHAMAHGAAALAGVVSNEVLQAFWVALGPLATSKAETALQVCEVPTPHSLDAWRLVTASLLGDTSAPPAEVVDLVVDSARKIGQPPPALPKVRPTDEQFTAGHTATPAPPPFAFESGASAARVAHAVRRWRNESDSKDVTHVVSAVLARLVEIEAEDPVEVRWLLHRIASDSPVWDADALLVGLAKGLEERGSSQLAAVAFTLAYTRARDGWRRFAGEESQELFTRALVLDEGLAWVTLTREVADGVTTGAEHGITVHLLELLAAGGRVDDAFACWEQSCEVIARRLPPVGPADDLDVTYDASADDVLKGLGACLVARLANVHVHVREAALAGLGLLVLHAGDQASLVVAHALECAANHAPPSVLLPLLGTIEEFESEPFPVTNTAIATLSALAALDFISIRTMARALLIRADLDVPDLPASELPLASAIGEDELRDMAGFLGIAQLRRGEEVWPGFACAAVAHFTAVVKSPKFHEQRDRVVKRLARALRRDRHTMFLPADEERERALQRTGAAVRTQLARQGVIDPSADEALGRALLPELGLGVRWALSRTPRPGHHPDLSTLSPGITAVDRLTTVADGMFKGWVVLAHHESGSKPGESFRAAIEQTLEVWSAVVLASSANEAAITDKLPIGHGDVLRWREVPKDSASPIMAGPLADFDITWGPFGTLKLLMPCEQLTTMSALTPAVHSLGLVLLDPAGDPAVVLRCWAETQLGDKDPGDEDHLVAGSEVLCRPDILNTALDFATDRPFTVTVINSPSTGMDED